MVRDAAEHRRISEEDYDADTDRLEAEVERLTRQLDAVKALADEWERDEAYACVNPHECLRCITAQRAVIRIRAAITDTEKGA